jgi:hypothetical protein
LYLVTFSASLITGAAHPHGIHVLSSWISLK